MISEKMKVLVEQSSVIRAMFEEGKNMAKLYGAENVYDFSLGNPSVNPPRQIKDAIKSVVDEEDENLVHGYMNNSGYEDVRDAVANSLNTKFGTNFGYENILMTVGAAGGLNVIFKTLLNPEDEVVVIAPFFGEYRNYVSNFDAKLVVVPPNTKDFMPNMEGLRTAITAKTKIVLINTPNNPTGVVYDDATLKELAKVLQEKEAQFNMPIYLVADEPYRELAYDNVEVPYVTKY